jgi:hypothetical protein
MQARGEREVIKKKREKKPKRRKRGGVKTAE